MAVGASHLLRPLPSLPVLLSRRIRQSDGKDVGSAAPQRSHPVLQAPSEERMKGGC